MKGSHGKVVAAILVGSELPAKISERVEGMGIIETLLIFAVAALYLAIMPWDIGADELVANPFPCQHRFKQRRNIALAILETIGKLKTVIGLYTFHQHPSPPEPFDGVRNEISGRVGTLLRVSPKETKS